MRNVSGVFSDLDRVLLRAEEIHARVREMAAEISASYPGREITVVALMDGALFYVADLLRHLDLPVRLVTLGASSYHGGTQSTGQVRFHWPEGVDLAGQDVLLLDDILDTGLTLHALRERLLSKRRVRSREVPVDYCGFDIADEFVVGYGMDYQGRFRNLPCIGILKL